MVDGEYGADGGLRLELDDRGISGLFDVHATQFVRFVIERRIEVHLRFSVTGFSLLLFSI